MELTLKIEGKAKKFKPMPNLPALRFKQAVAHATQLEENFDISVVEAAVTFIVNDIFGGKFTEEQFWEGLPAEDLISVVRDALSYPMFLMQQKLAPVKN